MLDLNVMKCKCLYVIYLKKGVIMQNDGFEIGKKETSSSRPTSVGRSQRKQSVS